MVGLFILIPFYLLAQSNVFVAAYDNMHLQFSRSYPFGKWKGIQWNALDSGIRPKIVTSGETSDTMAFYKGLREYVAAIPDGHVLLKGWADRKAKAMYQQVGGSYGFVLTKLDDGRIIVVVANPGSPATIAGVCFGAEILEINDHSVQEAMDTVSVLWAETNPATLECKQMNQYRFIGRAPVGCSIKLKFKNRGADDPVTVTLIAVDDNYDTYNQTSMSPVESNPGPVVSSRIIEPEEYGYIKLTMEHGDDSAAVKQIYNGFRNAIEGFNTQGVHGLILDMRVNAGGDDALSAAFSGFFYQDTVLYEYQTWYNPANDSIEIWPESISHFKPGTAEGYINPKYPHGSLFIEPQGLRFTKPVMVLVSPRNISSGEGIPMTLQRLPDCRVVGFHGTNGSFGMVEYKIYITPPPDDLYLRYPYGQSLDKDLRIQLEGDLSMTGGVIPDIRVPLNDTVIDLLYVDSIDVELNYAIKELNKMLGINESPGESQYMELDPVYPNPIHTSATINYRLEKAARVSLAVYDLGGKQLKLLVDEPQKAGCQHVNWNTGDISPGIYFLRLTTDRFILTRKCIIL